MPDRYDHLSLTNQTIVAIGAIFCAILLYSTNNTANATIIAIDDPEFGVDSLTRDNNQGLEFLDLTLTLNISFNDMQPLLDPGGAFEGFRYATATEVVNLINRSGFRPKITNTNTGTKNGTTGVDQLSALTALLGVTRVIPGTNQSIGITDTAGSGASILDFSLNDLLNNNNGPDTVVIGERTQSASDDFVGNFIVRDATGVPEPATIGIVASGLIGMGFMLRRRKSR